MSHEAYAAIEAVNWSSLKNLRDSALHYQYRLGESFDTPSMALGRVVHTLVFEPQTFESDYAVWEGGDRRGKDWQAFKAEHEGRTIFKPNELDEATAIAEAVRRHPLVQPYLLGGQYEQVVQWTDPETGMACKARPDWLLPDRKILLDLKSARSIEGRRFGTQAARLGYHCQLAHYAAGCEYGLGWKPRRVIIVAVENTAPYDVAVFEVDQESLFVGADEIRYLMLMLKACRASGQWPGRYQEEQALQLPAWVFGSEDDDDPDSFGLVL